ncbi:hypothetical protein Acr_00g0087370 [Actinidia rufa]|uniref:Uncharacterized protein n=1 Tax=Actinidia rufa TaxID=165716 RepID=A0A7J0DWP7_9ERIC|nr:hypothetical protein Acr_00g0087370 [Actinidia rufa]
MEEEQHPPIPTPSPRRSTMVPPPRHQPPPQDHHLVRAQWRRGRPQHLHPHRPLHQLTNIDLGFVPLRESPGGDRAPAPSKAQRGLVLMFPLLNLEYPSESTH